MMSKYKNEEPENHERWLVSYADFITLLFAFFVVMYATSNSDREKQKKFEGSIQESMKLPSPRSAASGGLGAQVIPSKSGNAPIDVSLPGAQAIQSRDLEEFLENFFSPPEDRIQALKRHIKIHSEPEAVHLDMQKDILLSQEGNLLLEVLGSLLKKADTAISIVTKLPHQDSIETAAKAIDVRLELLKASGLSDQYFNLVFLGSSSKAIDSRTIRFSISR